MSAWWPKLVATPARLCLSLARSTLYCFSHPEAVVLIDFWKLRCQTPLKYQSKIAKITLGSHCPQKVSARILTVPPYTKEEQFGLFEALISVTSSDEKRNPA